MREEMDQYKKQNQDLKSEVNTMKLKIRVEEQFEKPENDILKWLDNILKNINSQEQIKFVINAYKSYVQFCASLKKKIRELENMLKAAQGKESNNPK